MINNFPYVSIAASIGIFLFFFAVPAVSQVSEQPSSTISISHELASFTKVIDNKIDRSDSELVRAILEQSSHSEMLLSSSSNTLYIMDLDQFENGMPDFEVFGKQVKVLSKYELIDLSIPFYLTIDGYNKNGSNCEAFLTIHEKNGEGKVSKSNVIKLSKSTHTWEKQNLSK